MSANSEQLLTAVDNPIVWALSLWVAREVYGALKNKHAAITTAIENLSFKLNDNTIALARLEQSLEEMQKYTDIIPKIKRDVDAAHEKIRGGGKRLDQ